MILVTGATGFTGGHLCSRLASQGEAVRALVRPGTGGGLQGKGIELAEGDLRDQASLAGALDGVDTVYHLAASYRKGGASRSELFETNAKGTRNLLEAALRARVGRFVHCSTVGVLGGTNGHVASEDSPYAPGDAYQESKLEGELTALDYMQEMPVVVVRPAGIYGEGDTRFLKLFRAIKRRQFVMLGTGRVLYQMIHIDDLIDGFILCGTKEAAVGRIYILTGNEPVQLWRLVELVAEAVGVPAPRLKVPIGPLYVLGCAVEIVCRPLGIDPPLYRRRFDFFRKDRAFTIEKAKRELGFMPKVDLKSGIRETASWYVDMGLL